MKTAKHAIPAMATKEIVNAIITKIIAIKNMEIERIGFCNK